VIKEHAQLYLAKCTSPLETLRDNLMRTSQLCIITSWDARKVFACGVLMTTYAECRISAWAALFCLRVCRGCRRRASHAHRAPVYIYWVSAKTHNTHTLGVYNNVCGLQSDTSAVGFATCMQPERFLCAPRAHYWEVISGALFSSRRANEKTQQRKHCATAQAQNCSLGSWITHPPDAEMETAYTLANANFEGFFVEIIVCNLLWWFPFGFSRIWNRA
jgi:hypothetical protein